MITDIFKFIGDIIKPVTSLIDSVVTSDSERLELRNKLAELQLAMQGKILEYETKLMEIQAGVVKAEAMGQSWLQRNWRPITMMVFVYIIAHNYIVAPMSGLPALPIHEDMWGLMKLGIGGYVGGRSVEKIAPIIAEAIKNKGKGDDAS